MYRISQLADLAGLSRSTLLYYEKLGLIQSRRSANGYRYYGQADLQRLNLIQQLQAGGLTLQECKACLESRLDREQLERRLASLDDEIARKQKARDLLSSLLGKDGARMREWHCQLESTAPDAHFDWLMKQGYSEKDALRLRWLSRDFYMHEQYMKDFEVIFSGLDHLGPGSESDTLRALASVPEEVSDILDIGCGTGASSLVLAQHRQADIVALDNDAISLKTLEARVERLSPGGSIEICCASMFSPPFGDAAFDLLWCEGSVYIMGFHKALKQWRNLIKPGGYLMVSDLVWTQNQPPEEIKHFWSKEYPDMTGIQDRLRQAEELGYVVIDHFLQGQEAWDNYIEPLDARTKELESSMVGSQALNDIRDELKILRRFDGNFSYMMMVLRKD
ncbi:MAG: MerR family transcriptional regulator [Endozoicomonas sp.]